MIDFKAMGCSGPVPMPNILEPNFCIRADLHRGKGLFSAIEYKPAAEIADEEYPFQLTTGRVHVHYHTGTMTRNSPSLEREISECFLEMHPEDAAELNVTDGDWVVIASRRGSVSTRVKLTDAAGRKTVFMPFHFLESRANILTNPAFDPIAKIPEFKVCAVRIEKMGTESKTSLASTS